LAFTRAYRCLRSVRELAGRGEAEDTAVLARALLSLTLQYLWLVCTEDEAERRDRLRRLVRKWATEYAVLGEELLDLGYLPSDVRESVGQYRATADALERECVRRMPDERALAIRLDRDLQPSEPRFFELLYARIYRPTSHVAHYGLGAAVRGLLDQGVEEDPEALTLDRIDDEGAAESLGLALTAFGALLEFSEPIVRHGLAAEVAEVIDKAH
jgi:HEPN domain-containing protein